MEKRFLTALFFFAIFIAGFSQTMTPAMLLETRQKSWYRLYYKVPSDSMLLWLNQDRINFDYLNQLTPAAILPDSIHSDSLTLPNGQYILVKSNFEDAVASWFEVSETGIAFTENRRTQYLMVYHKEPESITDASVRNLKTSFEKEAKPGGFVVPKGRWVGQWIEVATSGDTLITRIEQDRNKRRNWNTPFYKRPFKYWPVVRFVYKIPKKIDGLFDGEPSPHRSNRLRKKYKTNGFVLFSQPLYKPGDTLRLKAWLTDGKEMPLEEMQDISISYQKNSRYTNTILGKLKPVTPGSYLYELPLPDSFPSDTRYIFHLQGKSKFAKINAGFYIEEYQLPDISSFSISSAKKSFLPADTIQIKSKALDASGLSLLDGSLECFLLTRQINNWNGDSLFIPDTLYHQSKPLVTSGETIFSIPISGLPQAGMELEAKVILRNSNNERQEKTINLTISPNSKKIEFIRTEQGLRISYKENDIAIPGMAKLITENNFWSVDSLLQLPCTIKPHPLASTYEVLILDRTGKKIFSEIYEASDDKKAGILPSIDPIFIQDSIGFTLYNPAQQAVWVTLFTGKKIIWEDTLQQAFFTWKTKASERLLYRVKYSYVHEGEANTQYLQIGLPYKWLQVQTTLSEVVQPGAKDTMLVKVTDYLNQPVKDVNISAVAYNTQLKDKINLPEIPLVHQYKKRKTHRSLPELNENASSFNKTKPLFQYPNIQRYLGTDTMLYYKFLYNKNNTFVIRSHMQNAMPELAVHAQKDGVPEPLYIVYANNRPIWSAIVNTKETYSYAMQPGFVKLSVRTKNQQITIDSIYLQPFFKQDVFLNLTALQSDKKATILPMPDTLLAREKNILENYFIRFEKHNDNEGAWIWQEDRVHVLNYRNNNDWIAGPFEDYLPLQGWKKNAYNTRFPMEKRHTYRIGKDLVRMEKAPLLPEKYKLNKKRTFWRIGEEIPSQMLPPQPKTEPTPGYQLTINRNGYKTEKGNAAARLFIRNDSSIAYQAWLPVDSLHGFMVNYGSSTQQHNLKPGRYYLLLIKADGRSSQHGPFLLKTMGTFCITLQPVFTNGNRLTDSLPAWQLEKVLQSKLLLNSSQEKQSFQAKPMEDSTIEKGGGIIRGLMADKATGIGIPGATIIIKGSKKGVTTNLEGFYEMGGLAKGHYTLVFNSVGYVAQEKKITLWTENTIQVNTMMEVSEMKLEEVIVVGYGMKSKKSMTVSAAQVSGNGFMNSLQGKVAGVQVTGNPGAGARVTIRGTSSINGNNEPLYVVDGVLMQGLPDNLDTTLGNLSIEILKGSAATAIYGSRASNGVIIIQTGPGSAPAIRSNFHDYAYWKPSQNTNEKGWVKIPISYPDNITNWQHAVYAAAKKGRYGRQLTNTKTFKAIQGQLSVPDFLIEGDSTFLIGKAMNYSAEEQLLETRFELEDRSEEATITVKSMDAATPAFGLMAPNAPDTLQPVFKVSDSRSRTDGEVRKIPVFEKGTIETTGSFFLLPASDTTVYFSPDKAGEPVEIYATSQLIDLLDKELESLKDYPYACMEQTANKLWGLQMMQSIKKATGQPFTYKKLMDGLENKLLKNQLANGGYSWWINAEANLHITTRVLQVLRQLPQTNGVKNALRNGYLYLQNILPPLDKYKKLEALYALSQGGHVYPYKAAVDTIIFDSLSLHAQWQYFSIAQQHSSFSDTLWQKLWQKRTESVLGALYWGYPSRSWYNAPKATMVVAYRAIAKDSAKEYLLPRLQQYFLEEQKEGFGNTVEKAEITNLLLQEALKNKEEILEKPGIKIGDGKTIYKFPFTTTIKGADAFTFRKTGAGIVYLTAFQKWQNKTPQRVDSLFDIATSFIQQGDTVGSLKTGNPATFQLTILAKKSAEFLMLEIPIPAGCVVTQKQQVAGQHREYLKGKVLVFIEQLNPGSLMIDIPIEVRFKGNYTQNPTQLELMYQPVFYGRNNIRTIRIN